MTDPCHSLTFNYEIELNCFSIMEFLDQTIRGGERLKKKVSVISVILLSIAIIAVPVFAAPATKIEDVTLTSITSQSANDPLIVDHTILHTTGATFGTCTLNIPGVGTLEGDWYSEWISRNKWSNYPDPDPEAELVITSKVVLTFTGGTFEGMSQRKITGYPIGPSSYFETYVVLHGTGGFRGQTLKSSTRRTSTSSSW